MLLAVDIGNTNIVVAIFNDEEIVKEWRIFSDTRRTGDEYFSILCSLLKDTGILSVEISSSVLSSVVPLLIGPFISAIQQLTKKKPLLLNPAIYECLPVHIPPTAAHSIGTDLLCNALEAWERFHGAAIVVDFGTALTFITVDDKAHIHGYAIAPGIGTSLLALTQGTAQLPSVPLEAPPSSLGKNTVHAMQSGIVLGALGMVESMVARMKRDLSAGSGVPESAIHVMATGGLNSVLRPLTDIFEVVDKYHTLKGLRRVALYCSDP